jgi:hypothetical protein
MSIATVVLGHWTLTAVGRSSDGLAAGNVLSAAQVAVAGHLVFEVMAVFFCSALRRPCCSCAWTRCRTWFTWWFGDAVTLTEPPGRP